MILIGGGISEINKQAKLSYAVLGLVRELTLKIWERIDSDAKFKGNFQGTSEPYAEIKENLQWLSRGRFKIW